MYECVCMYCCMYVHIHDINKYECMYMTYIHDIHTCTTVRGTCTCVCTRLTFILILTYKLIQRYFN